MPSCGPRRCPPAPGCFCGCGWRWGRLAPSLGQPHVPFPAAWRYIVPVEAELQGSMEAGMGVPLWGGHKGGCLVTQRRQRCCLRHGRRTCPRNCSLPHDPLRAGAMACGQGCPAVRQSWGPMGTVSTNYGGPHPAQQDPAAARAQKGSAGRWPGSPHCRENHWAIVWAGHTAQCPRW